MKNKLFKLFGFLSVVLSVYSCAVGPDFQKPALSSDISFRDSIANDSIVNDTIINLKWWEIFDDPVLESLVKEALANNKNVLIAASRVEQARANVKFTNADRGPKFGYSASASRTNMLLNVNTQNAEINNFNANANASWELDFWGKYKRASEAAKAELLASFYGKRAIEIALISEVASNYFKLLDFKTRLEISKKTLASRDSTLVIIQERFDYGYTHIIDVNQAQIQKAIAQTAVPQYERLIAFTENNLSVLLGKTPEQIKSDLTFYEYDRPNEIPSGLPSEVLMRRPDVLQAEQNYRALNANIGVAQAMRFPSISLTGLLGVGSSELSTLLDNGLGWGASAGITGPLFEWGKNARRVDIAREQAKQSLLTYENTVLISMQEVNNALVEIKTLKDELIARQLRLDAASNASYLSSQRYYQGVTSYLEVTENQRQEFDAELSYSDNFQALLNSYVNLYKALGGGWVSQEEIDKYATIVAKKQGVDVSSINKDSLVYIGQLVDLKLTKEQEEARKQARKDQQKLEREQRKAAKKNK